MPIASAAVQHFSLKNLAYRVENAVQPEDIRDVAVSIFHEMMIRKTRVPFEATGFELASDHELCLAFYRTVNELVTRAHRQSRTVGTCPDFVSHSHSIYCSEGLHYAKAHREIF
jgi:hypothetical protein